MTIQAQLADGRVLEFPDGTDPAVIQAAVKRMLSQQAPAPTPAPEEGDFFAPVKELAGEAFGKLKERGAGLVGGIEALGALGAGAVAQPLAGLAGIAQSINPFAEEGASARAVEATQEALSFQPRTEEGKRQLSELGEKLAPVGEVISTAEEFLGDETFRLTDSPALAAAAKTIPTAIGEVLGLAAGRGLIKGTQAVKAARKEKQITEAIVEAAPDIDKLKDVSRSVYKEIDDLKVSVKPKVFNGMVNKIRKEIRKQGFDKNLNPKVAAVMKVFDETILTKPSPSLTDIDIMRKIAQGAAKSLEPAEAALGARIINTMDEFLDNLGPKGFNAPEGVDLSAITSKYKTARDLWGRARRSELIQESFEKASLQASGFENGIRTQFRSILNNKKKSRFFKKEEIEAMRAVVKGGTKENILKAIGRLGFSEGQATNILGGAVGVAAGAALFGTPGAILVPVIGQVSRKLAQKLTRQGAEFTDIIVRAGTDARAIAKAYIDNVPKKLRSSLELSELLVKRSGKLDDLIISDNLLLREAAEIARGMRAIGLGEAAGVTAATAVLEGDQSSSQ